MAAQKSITKMELILMDDLLKLFVRKIQYFIDKQSYTFNVHLLTHLKDQIEQFGTISYLNASVFESWCGFLKKLNTGNVKSIINLVSKRYFAHKAQTMNFAHGCKSRPIGYLQKLNESGTY